MLAGFKRGNGHFGMQLVGGGDAHDVDGGIADQRAPVVGGAGKAELFGHGGCLVGRRVAQEFEPWRRYVAEHRPDRAIGQSMAFSHETGADEADAEGAHASPPTSATRTARPSCTDFSAASARSSAASPSAPDGEGSLPSRIVAM